MSRPSGQDLLETLRKEGFEAEDFDALDNLPGESVPHVAAWVARSAQQLGAVLAMTGRFFGPDAIIMAGRLPPAIITALTAAMDMRKALPPYDDLPLPQSIPSRLGSTAGMAGAAALPVFKTLLSGERT